MRHDWTLLCTVVDYQQYGTIGLGNIFTSLSVSDADRPPALGESVELDPPILLVSHWTAEFESDRRVHPAIVQHLAPGGDTVIWEDKLAFDVRETTSFRMIYALPNLKFLGRGIYEFQVFLDALGPIGEWGRACLTVS